MGLCHLTTMPSHRMLSRKPGMTVRMMMETSSTAAASTVCVPLDSFGSLNHSSTLQVVLAVRIYKPVLHPRSLVQHSDCNILHTALALVFNRAHALAKAINLCCSLTLSGTSTSMQHIWVVALFIRAGCLFWQRHPWSTPAAKLTFYADLSQHVGCL